MANINSFLVLSLLLNIPALPVNGSDYDAMDAAYIDYLTGDLTVVMPPASAIHQSFEAHGLHHFLERVKVLDYLSGRKTAIGLIIAQQLMMADYTSSFRGAHTGDLRFMGNVFSATERLLSSAVYDLFQDDRNFQAELRKQKKRLSRLM